MDSDQAWGRPAAAEVLSSLRPARGRDQTPLSALEEEVADLTACLLDEPGAEDDAKRELRFDRGWFADLSLVVVDAVLARDKKTLDAVESLLQRLYRAVAVRQSTDRARDGSYDASELSRWEVWLQSSSEYLRAAMERLAPVAAATAIAGGRGEQFLRIVAQRPGINSRQMGQALATAGGASASRRRRADVGVDRLDEAQVSRLGAKLRAEGLVFSTRSSQGLSWEISPRGELVLERLLNSGATPETNADHPVGSMVIATDNAAMPGVVAALAACAPAKLAILSGDRMSTYERSEPAGGRWPAQSGEGAAARVFHDTVLHAIQTTESAASLYRESKLVAEVLDRAASKPPADLVLSEELVYRQVESEVAGRL